MHLKIAGLSLLLLAFLHFFFPRRFAWKEELQRLSLLNRQIFYVHCFFIILIVVFFGVLSLFYGDLLLQPTPLSRIILIGLTLFWLARLVIQLFVYDRSLWIGHRFNTMVHVGFSLLWTYYVAVYLAALCLQK